MVIRELFDKSKPIDRRIEKVITYETTNEELLKEEVQEYVATDSIEDHFERLLDRLEEGMSGGNNPEIGVWVSGFYGSGKSSFTKYLGFALDPTRTLDGKPFFEWLQNQFKSKPLRARLATVAKKSPSAVIMLDLASEMLAGATMAEISSVLYAKVMQWAGYSRDEKIAYLEFMLERDKQLDKFKERISELSKGKGWDEIKNQPLVMKALASKVASEFYPELFPDSKAFNEIRIEERIKEDDRVKQMLDIIDRKTGKKNIIFILDEVGQYIAARDDLILNLDGLAKNVKGLGRGHAWVIATAQQTLTEDDPRAVTNTAKLFKLKDRFPVSIDLIASDIKEICYKRLLGKSKQGEEALATLFDGHGPQMRHATELKNTKYYKADLNKETFCKYYPFLPQHFDILLQLLARLAKTRGGVGLRSAIKVIQDVLVAPGKIRRDGKLLADESVGKLATTMLFYDTLRADIERPFPHIINGIEKVKKVFGEDSLHTQVAKSVAVLQILEDFPVGRENIAALMHPSVESASLLDSVNMVIDEMLNEESIPLNEVDGSLRFMSEAVIDLENERLKIIPRVADTRSIQNAALRGIFSPAPAVKLNGTRSVSAGFKVYTGAMTVALSGDKEAIQAHIDFVSESEYEKRKNERILESQQKSSANVIFLLGHEDKEIDDIVLDIYRCREIYKQHKNKAADKEVEEYLRAQYQRGDIREKELSHRLKNTLVTGSFIFRGKPKAVSELDAEVAESARKYLETVAIEVFHKYAEAPVQADSATAERFLKTEKLNKISSKDDPLTLVKKSGNSSVIDNSHKAIISIKDYLEQRGQVDGRRLLDDFFAAPCGWSKDTTRYLVAAMLVAAIIKLRVSGEDITVRGEVAINNLRNTNSFNKIGISLRDTAPPPDMLFRARDRLLKLTAEDVLPLEEEISKCVMHHFPDFQQDYAPLATQLENRDLQGSERAQNVNDNLSEILKGDASDATNRLGSEECPLYNDLSWAREVKKSFDNGIGTVVKQANELLAEIPKLPDVGIPGALIAATQGLREELSEYVTREDFYKHMPEIQNHVANIGSQITTAATKFAEEQASDLKTQINRLQVLPEWNLLGTEDKARLGGELDGLQVEGETDLEGLKHLINNKFLLSTELYRIESEIRELAKREEVPPEGEDEEIEDMTISVLRGVVTATALEDLLVRLHEIRSMIDDGKNVRITWK